MKRKLLSLFLALVMAFSLAAPALAREAEGADEWEAWKEAYAADHPDEVAAFDADAYFSQLYYGTKQEYMLNWDISSEEEFYEEMLDSWFYSRKHDQEREAFMAEYEAEHPGTEAAFDPDAWFQTAWGSYGYTKENYLADFGESEEEFRQAMWEGWIDHLMMVDEWQTAMDDYLAEHPGALDGFDVESWFASSQPYWDKQEYMDAYELYSEEEFILAVQSNYVAFLQLAEARRERIAAYQAEHPGALDSFDADAWFAAEFKHDTKEDFMDYNSITSEAHFQEVMIEDYLDHLDALQAQKDMVAQYLEEHPGALDGFDPMAYLESRYGYRDPKAAFMEDNGLETDEDFLDFLQYAYVSALQVRQERKDRIAAYEAEHPGTTGAFDADAYFEGSYYSWRGKERFMKEYELDTEEDFHDYLLCQWIDEQSYGGWMNHDDYDYEKAVLGGVPGELGIMVDGVYLTFPAGQKPYANYGTTFVPSDVLGEALGVTPQVISDNGYSPLRSTAEAAGYKVYWDQDFETAVLLNTKALAEEMDGRYTILNKSQAACMGDPSKTYKTSYDIDMDITLFNSLDGDQVYPLSLNATQITSPEGYAFTGTYDLASLEGLIQDAMGEDIFAYMDEADLAEYQRIMDLFKSGSFDMRADYAAGTTYVSASILPTVFSIMGRPYPKDLWLSMESPNSDLTDILAGKEVPTMGQVICGFANTEETHPVYYHSNILNLDYACALIVGDDRFAAEGRDHVVTLDAQDFWDLTLQLSPGYAYYGYKSAEDLFKEFDLELRIKGDGSVEYSFVMRPKAEGYLRQMMDMRLALTGTANSKGQRMDMDLHWKNQYKVTITVTSDRAVTSTAPELAPPEGAAVIPLDGLDL